MAGKVVVRIKGGLGNQLFSYAASRRLALVNDAELVIDDASGFARDRDHGRRYMLDPFRIPARKATPRERLEPFERYRRGAKKWWSRTKPFEERSYLEQDGVDFDERLLTVEVKGTLYLDGLWQSEGYFKDVEDTVRDDLRIIPPADDLNQRMAQEIRNSNAVALHVRWFHAPGSADTHNLTVDYYRRSVNLVENRIPSPHYFLFSDDPEAARVKLSLPNNRITCVSHNRGDEDAYADLWLMTLCRHFITANSTFSWWGAWLGGNREKLVVTPGVVMRRGITSWNFSGQIPNHWERI